MAFQIFGQYFLKEKHVFDASYLSARINRLYRIFEQV